MAKQLRFPEEMNRTCGRFAAAALEIRRRGLPTLPSLQELWCQPAVTPPPTAAPTATAPKPTLFARLRAVPVMRLKD